MSEHVVHLPGQPLPFGEGGRPHLGPPGVLELGQHLVRLCLLLPDPPGQLAWGSRSSASPLPRWGYFAGRVTAIALIGVGSGAVIVAVGVAMAGLHLSAGAALVLLVTFVLGAAAWAAAGTAITALVPTAQGANPVLIFTYLPVILFSGGFGSLNGLPHWLATLMSYLPGEPLIDAAAHALQYTGGGVAPLAGRDLAVLAAWVVAGVLASIRFFRWDPVRPAHARRPPG